MRFFTSFLTLVVLLLCVFFAFSYFDSKYLLVATDAEYAKNTGTQLLELFLIVSIAAAMFLSLLIYSVLSTQNAARRMAYAISKDMSFSKEQFRRFYELSPVPYLLISPKGTITRPNKASLRFFGRTEEN